MSPQYRTAMKQYNRIMPGEHGKFLTECLEHGYIGASWIPDHDLSTQSHDEESIWRQSMTSLYLDTYPDKSIGTARTSVGFLRTICFGLSKGDIILASNGKGSYHVGEVAGDYYYAPGSPHRGAHRCRTKGL